jgi:hypothetical protein
MKKNYYLAFAILAILLSAFNKYGAAQSIGTLVIHDKLTASDSTITDLRLFRDGVSSTCPLPKPACPGTAGAAGVYYKAYYFTNESAADECIIVRNVKDCNPQIFNTAYLNAFDPTNVCTNYLADAGTSVIAAGGQDSLSFIVPAGVQYCLVVNGVLVGDTCESYTMYITQAATSLHGSIAITDSTQSQRLFRDGIPCRCDTVKTLCANAPFVGTRYHDGYVYLNNTGGDVCILATAYHLCTDLTTGIFSASYLSNYDSLDVCLDLLADAGLSTLAMGDSIQYSFNVPNDSTYIVLVYGQIDGAFCDDYKLKLETFISTGIENLASENAAYSVYPNPITKGEDLIIKTGSNAISSIPAKIDLYDITGRIVFSKSVKTISNNQITIPTSQLSRGMYLLKIADGTNNFSKKLVIE